MVCCGQVAKQFTKDDQILSHDDMMELVRLKRKNTVEYQETLRTIAEVLRDIQKVVEEVNKGK